MNKNYTYRELFFKVQKILGPENSFYITSIVYGVGVSLLTLAIPISIQALVNTVTFGVLLQPLVVLSILLLGLLIFSGFLKAIQTYVIEMFQQRFLARTSAQITQKLLYANPKELNDKNGLELTNRFFDIMTVKKSVTLLVNDGVAIFLQLIVGMTLIAIYHPYFLLFDILLTILLILTWKLFGKSAIDTAIKESGEKYKIAAWLEELSRVNLLFKSYQSLNEGFSKSDSAINEYLNKRNAHFKLVFYQTIFLLFVYAFLSALILGLGGFLVIKQQLSLGQLVAAELIVTIIMSNFLKFSKYLESFYDLVAAVDKLSVFDELSQIEDLNTNLVSSKFDLKFQNVMFETISGNQININFNFEHGKKYQINCASLSTRSIFTDLTYKFSRQTRGDIILAEVSFDKLNIFDIKDKVCIVDTSDVVDGTIEENLKIFNQSATSSFINEVLEVVDLNIKNIFKDGIYTKINSSGSPLWSSQIKRLTLARAIIARPKVLILTETFDQIALNRRKTILDYLSKMDVTLILCTNKNFTSKIFDEYLYFDRDGIRSYLSEDKLVQEEFSSEV